MVKLGVNQLKRQALKNGARTGANGGLFGGIQPKTCRLKTQICYFGGGSKSDAKKMLSN